MRQKTNDGFVLLEKGQNKREMSDRSWPDPNRGRRLRLSKFQLDRPQIGRHPMCMSTNIAKGIPKTALALGADLKQVKSAPRAGPIVRLREVRSRSSAIDCLVVRTLSNAAEFSCGRSMHPSSARPRSNSLMRHPFYRLITAARSLSRACPTPLL